MNYKIIFVLFLSLIISSCSESPKEEVKKETLAKEKHIAAKDGKEDTTSHSNRSPLDNEQEDETQNKVLVNQNTFNIEELDLVIGDRNSKVILLEYSSPTCPHCSYFHKEVLPKIKKKYVDTGKIAYVLREFVTNKQDLDASLMGRCYKNKEDPLKLLNLLYIQQENWAFNKNYREILINLGGLAGVSRDEYNRCMGRKDVVDFLLHHAKNISTYPGFVGTPAFFINGQMYKMSYSFDGLSKAIDEALDNVKSNIKEGQ